MFPQSWVSEMRRVIFTEEMPQTLDPERNSLIIFDDFLANGAKLKDMSGYFIIYAQYSNVSLISSHITCLFNLRTLK